MVLYELLCIARVDIELATIREIAKNTGMMVLNANGVVRKYENWGTIVLPKKIRKYQNTNTHGRYWLMHFDTSPRVVGEMRRKLSLDPRVIRHQFFKLGDKYATVSFSVKKDLTTLLAHLLPLSMEMSLSRKDFAVSVLCF